MRKVVLAGVAALSVLGASTAHADQKWGFSLRQCHVTKVVDPPDVSSGTVALDLEDVLELQKFTRDLKKCEAWYKCLTDRDQGKVKHCYANDRRWR
jgi:hypothetical protein